MDSYLREGYIINSIGGFYDVAVDHERIRTRARGVFRNQGIKPVPGDKVMIRMGEGEMLGYIDEILPRKNQLLRPPVANVDQVAVVMSVKAPKLNSWVLDRMLVIAAVESVKSFVVLSKADLDEQRALYWKDIYEKAGYTVFVTRMSEQHEYPDLLKRELEGKITAFMGPSGVGKSSLINAIADHSLETGEVSEKTSRGKHTTRHVHLYPLDTTGYVFDTPGFTAVELGRILEEPIMLRDYFPEMEEMQSQCRFQTCLHDQEPGCVVKEAVKRGEMSTARYEHYIDFLHEIQEYRRY